MSLPAGTLEVFASEAHFFAVASTRITGDYHAKMSNPPLRSSDQPNHPLPPQEDSETAERLTALEIKAAYSEDLLDRLNMTIYRQQQQIDRLAMELHELRTRMPEPGTGTAHSLRDEIPPHY